MRIYKIVMSNQFCCIVVLNMLSECYNMDMVARSSSELAVERTDDQFGWWNAKYPSRDSYYLVFHHNFYASLIQGSQTLLPCSIEIWPDECKVYKEFWLFIAKADQTEFKVYRHAARMDFRVY